MLTKLIAGCAALTLVGATQADALGLGLGGKRGGKSTSTSSTRGGISAGVSAGHRGVSANVSVGRNISAGASVGAGGVSATTNAGAVSTSTSVSKSGLSATVDAGSTSLSVSAGSAAPTTSAAASPAASALAASSGVGAFALPPWLLPFPERDGAHCPARADCEEADLKAGMSADIGAPDTPDFDVREGTPDPIVQACRVAAAIAAREYSALSVTAASAGRVSATGDGGVVAPVTIRIVYSSKGGGTMIRQAQVRCTMNGRGQVTALA